MPNLGRAPFYLPRHAALSRAQRPFPRLTASALRSSAIRILGLSDVLSSLVCGLLSVHTQPDCRFAVA
jgi:hypothetical protein